jgi:transcriptional regulator with XRE-family HTH domain
VEHPNEIERLKAGTCGEVCHYLAMKVRKHRQDAGLSQADFASQAGVPLRTYKRFESHGKANLQTFIEVLRAMERTQYLLMLFPAQPRAPTTPTLDDRLRTMKLRASARRLGVGEGRDN